MLDGLVGGAVLAQADRVVGPDVGDGQVHERGEADGRPHVVAERQEGAAVGPGQALQGDAVEYGAHGVFADAEVQGPAVGVARELLGLPVLRDEGGLALHGGVVAAGQVGGAAPQFRQHRGEGGEHLAGRLAGGHALGVGREHGQGVLPAVGQPLLRQAVQQAGPFRVGVPPVLVARCPALACRPAALLDRAGVGEDLVLDGEVGVRVEAEQPLGRGDLLVAQGRSVGLAGVLLRRGGPADDGAQHDQGRPGPLPLRRLDGGQQRVDVLDVVTRAHPVHRLHVPAVRGEAGRDVLAEGDVGVVLDGDVVRVVERHEVAELLVPGQGRGLGRDALHHVAVGGQDVHVVVEGAGSGGRVRVEQTALAASRHRHADRGAHALPQGAGGDLHAAGVPVLRVPGGRRAPGPQGLEVLHLQAVAGQVELDVEGEAAVAAGQHEAVPAQPLVVGGVVAHDPLEQQVGEGGQAHRRTGVPVALLLYRVGGQHPDGVHRPQVHLAPPRLVGHRTGESGVSGRGETGRGLLRCHGVSSPSRCRFSVRGTGPTPRSLFGILDSFRRPRIPWRGATARCERAPGGRIASAAHVSGRAGSGTPRAARPPVPSGGDGPADE